MAAEVSKADRLSSVLETDLRLLSAETRRSEGFTSWLTGPDFPRIKEAAERGVLKLRSVTGRSADSAEAVQKSKELLKPFLLACQSKNAKLASIALISFQKLLANEAVSDEGFETITRGLEQVEEMHDEGLQLKMLQTVLTMLQSSVHAHLEDCIRDTLGIGFRLLGNSRNSDSVVSTASATVRQAVALVFEHISLTAEEMQQQPPPLQGGQGPESPRDGPEGFSSGSANAALKLLDDLCLMAGGSPCAWLRAVPLPRTFVLEMLDFVLAENVAVFQSSPVFEHALLSRVCHLLLAQLHDLLDPTLEGQGGHGGHGHHAHLRIVLRTSRTVLRKFHGQLGAKCGAFIEVLLSGVAPNCALWQRVGAIQTLHQICEDPQLVQHLFVTYDMRWEVKLAAVQKVVQTCADIIDSALSVAQDGQQEAETDAFAAIAALHQALADGQGKQMLTEAEVAHTSSDTGVSYVAMMAVECIAAVVFALHALTVAAIAVPEESSLNVAESASQAQQGESKPSSVDPATCRAMADRLSAIVQHTLSSLIRCGSPGSLFTLLFQCYREFVEACGLLDVVELRDSFLKNLNAFAFTFPDSEALVPLNGGIAALQLPTGGMPQPQQQRLFLNGTEKATLDAKNLVALRTLFAIATRLALRLGDSWMLVLGTVNCVDCILATPRQTLQEGSTHGHSPPLTPSDMAEVSEAAGALFQRTADMSDEAVVTLLGALHLVSSASLSTAALQAGHTKLFALERMVQVLHVNMHRIYDLWGIFLSHVLEVLASSKASLRTAAMDAVGKAIIGALARPIPTEQVAEAADASGGVEHMLLVALTSLYTDEREADVRLGVLRVAINVLQRHGERLTRGWVPLLRLLAAVPQKGSPDAIKLGFQSLELLCSDYLSSLTLEQLRKCLEVAALYAGQQADLNVTLTAISQLWNAADFLARLPTRDPQNPSADIDAAVAVPYSSGPPSLGAIKTAVDSSKYAELLEVLFNALQALSIDSRPEVRNSGVRTLFSVVVSHGSRLSPEQWRHVWWSMCFPLLRTVHLTSTTSSREEAQVEVLGKLRGEAIKMLVHHSRNSQQKQWDETLVLALSGTGRLLRAHLHTLQTVLPEFDQGWEELMLVVESSMAGGRHETASAAVTLLTAVLTAHAGTGAITRTMWKRALQALTIGVEAATHPECSIPIQARLELLAGIATLLSSLPEVFDEADMRLVFGWLTSFVCNPWSRADAPVWGDQLLPVQKAALGIMGSFTHLRSDQLWLDLLASLAAFLRPHQMPTGGEVRQSYVNSATMAAAVRILAEHYAGPLPTRLRAAMLPGLLQRLGACMAARHTTPGQPLWRAAAAAFQDIVAAGVPAVNMACVNGHGPPEVWQELAAALEVFFFGGGRTRSRTTTELGGGNDGASAEQRLPPAPAKVDAMASPATSPSVTLNFDVDSTVEATTANSSVISNSSRTQGAAESAQNAASTSRGNGSRPAAANSTSGPGVSAMEATTSTGPGTSAAAQPTRPADAESALPAVISSSAAANDTSQEDSQLMQADATLECAVLDVLTDVVLTSCPFTPPDITRRFVHIIDRGVSRTQDGTGQVSHATFEALFPMACLRKLGALSQRGGDESSGSQPHLLHIAQVAFPLLLARCRDILRHFASEQSRDSSPGDPLQLELVMCTLQVCRHVHLSPLVADVNTESPMATQLLQVLRSQSPSGRRERPQLLYLYEAFIACIPAVDPRVRESLRDVLSLAGTEMGLAPPAT